MQNESNPAPGNSPTATAASTGPAPGRFDLREELGQGSSGTVYRATLRQPLADLPAGSDIAVKFLRRELLDDPLAQARLAEEGELGLRVRCPQVVRIYGAGALEVLGMKTTYLLMELVEGRSLREVLEESGSVVEELARRIGRDAALGLRALHQLRLVHRDIKPENLALTRDGDVKLMDLGLAQRIQRGGTGARGSGFSGSLSYAAPEVLLGHPATPRSDLYSLGVVLFEILTGVHPFAPGGDPGADPDAIIDAHIQQAPPWPSHFKPRVSAFLERLILDLLAKDPDARPSSAAELVVTFERGENSRYWLRHEQRAPRAASRRRLRDMRRATDVAFVGRAAELARLDDAMRSAIGGRGGTVFVSGPRGMGRRRLLDHWLEGWLERSEAITFLGGEAGGGAGVQRAAPFTDMILEWHLRGDLPGSPEAQARLAARIASETPRTDGTAERLAAIVCGSDTDTGPEARAALLVEHLLALRLPHHTLVLRVDLAEQLSTTAELVVARLAELVGDHRCLLLIVSQDGRRPPPGADQLALQGMELPDYLELGHRLFAGNAEPRPDTLIEAAHVALAGSPGNLLDALAYHAEQGKLSGRPGSYRLREDLTELRPPSSLLDRLARRVTALSKEQRHVHEAAAVLGNTFPLADLAALVGRSELAVLEALSVFQGRLVVTHRGTGAFRHRDFRKALLKAIPPETRRRLHRSAAWVLEDRGAPALDVGLHLSRAGEHTAAVAPLLSGLAHLVATGSRQNSAKVSQRLRIHLTALAVAAPPGPVALRLAWLRLDARVEELLGRTARAIRRWQEVATQAVEQGDDAVHAEALIALGTIDLGQGRLSAALIHAERASTLLGEGTDHRDLLARSLSVQSRVHVYLGRSEDALYFAREAVRALPADDAAYLPHLHVDLARIETLRCHFVAALKSLARAETMFRETASSHGLLRVALHRGHTLAQIGQFEAAARDLDTAHRRAADLRDPRSAAKAMLFTGQAALRQGDTATATAALQAVRQLAPDDAVSCLWAALHLRDLGVEPLDPTAAGQRIDEHVAELGLPGPRAMLLLQRGDAASIAAAVALERQVTLPLLLRRRILIASGRQNADQHLVREIAGRLPAGPMRRRFLAFMRRALA